MSIRDHRGSVDDPSHMKDRLTNISVLLVAIAVLLVVIVVLLAFGLFGQLVGAF